MTDAELVDYFNEHVFYELLMLCYSRQCLESGETQLDWNAMFATFNVSARNLYDFFNNKGKRTEVNVDDYKRHRKDTRRDSTSDVQGTLGLLNAQCLHMSKTRTKETDEKINLDRIKRVSAWVISNMDNLLETFNDDFGSKIRPEWADLLSQKRIAAVLAPEGPSACSVPSILTTSGPTGSGQIIQFDTPKK